MDQEFAVTGLAADKGEAQEVDGLRFAEPALLAIGRRMAAELDQAGLVRMEAAGDRRPGGQDRPGRHGHGADAIYEEDFLGFSYGFRPGRGPHDALHALVVGIADRKVNYMLDADIRSFFDTENSPEVKGR